jgi:hypothetical protein
MLTVGSSAPYRVTKFGHAYGVTSNPTTTSGTLVNLTDLAATLTTVGGDLFATTTVNLSGSTTPQLIYLALALDGTAASPSQMQSSVAASGASLVMTTSYHWAGVTAGAHTITTQWATSTGTATAVNTARVLIVEEARR